MSEEILVLCPFGLDQGLLSKAVSMAKAVRLLVREEEVSLGAACGARYIHTLQGKVEDEGDFARWLAEKITQWESRVILSPAEIRMRNIMPLLSWHLKAGLTADCTALEMNEGKLLQTRPAFGNSLIANIESLSSIQMATVRTGTFQPKFQKENDYITIVEEYTPSCPKLAVTGAERFLQGKPLTQAEIIVAGGLGVGSKEGFEKLRLAAQKLGAAVGATRSAVDAGFASYNAQIGMTGVTVCPKLYIAVGISGAVQHLAGMSGSTKVVAINSDPKAPIFDYADYGIVGDWEEIVDQLLQTINDGGKGHEL